MNSPNPIETDWYAETYFYILAINGNIKFGITANWLRRMNAYRKEIGDVEFRVVKQELHDKRWKAELLEQIVKWRLRPWVFEGRHEWINAPIQMIIDCYIETRDAIVPEISRYEDIHKKGNNRWAYYKQIADMLFDKK